MRYFQVLHNFCGLREGEIVPRSRFEALVTYLNNGEWEYKTREICGDTMLIDAYYDRSSEIIPPLPEQDKWEFDTANYATLTIGLEHTTWNPPQG